MRKWLSVFIFMFLPMSAQAWEQTMTCYDEYACGEYESLPTFWEQPCITFHLNENGTQQIPFEDVENTVQKSVQAWIHPEISSLQPHFSGLTNEDRIGYNPYISDNANIIVFRDENWQDSRSMMALTTVTHHNGTGYIYDADIEINTTHWNFGIVETPEDDFVDLENTLTHEIGHVFGLAHSGDVDATMFAFAAEGMTNLRTLEQDDLDAIANIYPPSSQICSFKNDYFERPPYEMNEGPTPDSCSTNTRVPSNIFHIYLWLAALGILYFRRKWIAQFKA